MAENTLLFVCINKNNDVSLYHNKKKTKHKMKAKKYIDLSNKVSSIIFR